MTKPHRKCVQKINGLMFQQILPTCTLRNTWRSFRRVDTFDIGFKRLWLFVHRKLDLAVKLRSANKIRKASRLMIRIVIFWLRIVKEINHLACLPLPEVVSIKVTTYHRWRQMVKSYTSIVKTFASSFDALQMRTSIFSGPFVANNSLDYA